MRKIKTIYTFILSVVFSFCLVACGEETDPVKAFKKGEYEIARNIWTPMAEQGDAEAQNYLGIMYFMGLGVNKDFKKSITWFEKAAMQGHADAQRNYADMIHFARGTQKDIYQAYKWYFAASQQGNNAASKQIEVIAASGNLSPNQQMHAKIEANEFILDEKKRFMSHDTYIDKK